jgi:hypothetical protein
VAATSSPVRESTGVRFQRIELSYPDIRTVIVFCFLKTDWIRAFYAGALPSFAECNELAIFACNNNQFTGA